MNGLEPLGGDMQREILGQGWYHPLPIRLVARLHLARLRGGLRSEIYKRRQKFGLDWLIGQLFRVHHGNCFPESRERITEARRL